VKESLLGHTLHGIVETVGAGLSTAALALLPAYNAESPTSLQDGLRPRWLPEVNHTVPNPIDNAVKRLQTSARPEYDSGDADGTGRPASIPSTDHRTSLVGESASSNASRDEMTSPEIVRDDERTLIEKTLLQLKPSLSSGNYLPQDVFVSV